MTTKVFKATAIALLLAGCALTAAAVHGKAVATTPQAESLAIAEKMANAIDYYNAVSAAYVVKETIGGQTRLTDIVFDVRVRPNPGARAELTSANGARVTMVANGDQELVYSQVDQRYQLTTVRRSSAPTPSFTERLSRMKDKHEVSYRNPETSLPTKFADALFPQQEALALIGRSTVTEEGQEKLLGRPVQVLTIVPPDILQKSLQANVIRFWVDIETGILVKQEYIKAGQVVFSQEATRLVVNPVIDSAKFKISIPPGATRVDTNQG
ncbi:MAG TPA: hypothetical protein VGK74_15195 [Symbiobacteriaceae bacterium]